jgi:hypothetical protein
MSKLLLINSNTPLLISYGVCNFYLMRLTITSSSTRKGLSNIRHSIPVCLLEYIRAVVAPMDLPQRMILE